MAKSKRPLIVCLCGSTRPENLPAFQEANFQQTMLGKIVLSIGIDTKSDNELFKDWSETRLAVLKARLDALHLQKIDLADEVFIVNSGGYIGDSTRREIMYAYQTGKPISYLESPSAEYKFTVRFDV